MPFGGVRNDDVRSLSDTIDYLVILLTIPLLRFHYCHTIDYSTTSFPL